MSASPPPNSRVPAPDLLPDVTPPPPPVATRDSDGNYGLVYFPLAGQRLRVDLRPLAGRVNAEWFDPREGRSHPAGEHPQ